MWYVASFFLNSLKEAPIDTVKWFCFIFGRTPNVKNVKDLIYKKGIIKIGKERVPLTDNNIIEQVC